ncbi:type II secretion system protein N [Marinimicrobium alkaliphilum]|uniref:type II secretion system protein N n=1 Tax=Marinimicrobium alkaliphilum TaxID=2202654 RepID=UPI0013009607|nr:type II secretion system protein N [Marinimicrobium alkaliphilum]
MSQTETPSTDKRRSKVWSILLWSLLGLVFFLWFVLTQIPAHWGAWAMTRSGNVALSGVNGTLWNGRASLATVRVDGEEFSLGELRWRIEGGSLLVLSPCARVQTQLDRQRLSARVCASLNGNLVIHDADISAPATVIEHLVPDELDGQLSGRFERVELDQTGLRYIRGNGSWRNVRVNDGQNWYDIGSFAADFSDDGEGNLVANIFDLEGVLGLEVKAQVYAIGGVHLDGIMSLDPGFAEEIQAREWIDVVAEYQGRDDNNRLQYRLDLSL